MKEFNLILDKVAHALNMTVDSVVKLYPQLRTEYSWYYVCNNLQDIVGTTLIIIGAGLAIFCLPTFMADTPEDDNYKLALKVVKWGIVIGIILAILFVVSVVLKGFMCPDIMIIKEFLK